MTTQCKHLWNCFQQCGKGSKACLLQNTVGFFQGNTLKDNESLRENSIFLNSTKSSLLLDEMVLVCIWWHGSEATSPRLI